MRASTLPAVLVTLTLAACSESVPTAPTAAGAALARRDAAGATAAARRPISGRCELTVSPLPSAPPILRQTDTGTCQVSHLGRSHFEGVLVLNVATGTQRGERTLTAANGDVLRLVTVGTSTPSGPGMVRFAAAFTFVGGTGRFANATGQARGVGTANLATSQTTVAFDGWIAYDADDRRGR